MELGNMQKNTLPILLEVKNGMPPIGPLPFKYSHFSMNRDYGRKSKMKLVSICNFGSSPPSLHHLPMLVEFHITTMNKATTRMVHVPILSSFPSTLPWVFYWSCFSINLQRCWIQRSTWYPKEPCLNGCFNWMMNQTFTLLVKRLFHHFHPLKTGVV